MIPENRASSKAVPSSFAYTGERGSPLTDTEMGGVALRDASQGLLVKMWHCRYDRASGDLLVGAAGVPEVALFNRPDITEVSLTFDQNMAPFVAFVQAGAAKFWWYDPIAEDFVFEETLLAGCANPRCSLDDKRSFFVGSSDIILAYVRAGSLYYRMQRDRYLVEYMVQPGVRKLHQCGMGKNNRFQWSYEGVGMPDDPFLAYVVEDLCARAGIPRANVDVSDLWTHKVSGLRVDSDDGLTAPIDQLRKVFPFDKAEYDRVLHFPSRGRGVVARIPYSDLVRGNPTSLKQERVDENDLAREVNVNHIDPDGGFAKNKQFAQRRSNVVNAKGKKNVSTQVVLTVDQAATAADLLLRIDWNEQVDYKFSTTIKWTELTVADVVEVEDKAGTWHRMRIEERNEDGTIEWKCKQDAGQRTYGSARTGHSLPPPTSTTPGIVGETRFEIMDVSPLLDQDDELGLYVAAAGEEGMAWTGYQLMVSVDGGLSYAEVFRSEQASTLGDSTTDIAAEPGHDVLSALTFRVTTNFPLSSADPAQVLSGQNRFCLGGEVGQFQTATLLGMVGTLYHYELSGLRRAKYGTAAAFWPAGSRFVLLDATVAFVQAQRNTVGVDLHYKPISFGHTQDDTVATAYLFDTPDSQTEWMPDTVAAARDGVSNDVTVTWAGRPRLGQFGTPFNSKYWRGFRVTFSDSHTIDTTAQTVIYPNAPVGVTVRVCALNEITGVGPASAPVAT